MSRGIQNISQRNCTAKVSGHHHHRMVDATVSRPEAVAFYFPRGPEGFERRERKDTGGDGLAEVGKRRCFVSACKGKHAKA